ncbi:hypothetical protein pb186bvf_006040 [Paramecium bursaria]
MKFYLNIYIFTRNIFRQIISISLRIRFQLQIFTILQFRMQQIFREYRKSQDFLLIIDDSKQQKIHSNSFTDLLINALYSIFNQMQQKTRILIDQILKPIQNYKNQGDSQIKNYFYQSILFILEYIFTDKQIQAKNVNIDQKEVLVSYIEKFRNFVIQKSDENFLQITNKLIGKRYEQLNDEQEGFISSDDEKKRVTIVSTVFQDLFENSELTKQQVQQVIKQKDNQILMLSQLIKQRDNTIIDLATGYLKEIQNMRDQMFRSEVREDYFQIQYFDISIIEDERLKELVNQKIQNIKSLYELQIRKMNESILSQNAIIQNQRQDIQNLESKTQVLQNVEYLVERIFFLEKNPYQIWKLIQNAVGCEFFYEVFENQKETSGIDYKEVNKMLMSSKAYEREFEYFKKSIEDQMVIYLERAIDVINQQDISQQEVLNNMATQLAQQKEVNSHLQQEVDKLNDNYQIITKMRIPEEQIDIKSIENQNVKKVFLIWKIMNQQFNLNHIEQNKSRKAIQDLLYGKQMKIDLQSLQINTMNKEMADLRQKYQDLKVNYDNQAQILKICQRNQEEQIAVNKNYQNCITKIFNYLNLKLQINQFILLDNKSKEIKQFEERINKLLSQKYGIKVIQELNFQVQKNNLGLLHLKPSHNEMFTQTDLQVKDQYQVNKNQQINNNQSVKRNLTQDQKQNNFTKFHKHAQTDLQSLDNSPQILENSNFRGFKEQLSSNHFQQELAPEINQPLEVQQPNQLSQQDLQLSNQQNQLQDDLKLSLKLQNLNQKPSKYDKEQKGSVHELKAQYLKDIQQTRSLNVSSENLDQLPNQQQINTPFQYITMQIQTPLSTTKHIQQLIQVQKQQQQNQISLKFQQQQKQLEIQQLKQLQFLQKMVFQNKECLSHVKEQFYQYLQFYQRLIEQIKKIDLRCTHYCKQHLNLKKIKQFNINNSQHDYVNHKKIDKSLKIEKIIQFQLPDDIDQFNSERLSNQFQTKQSKKQKLLFQTTYIQKQRALSIDQSSLYKHQLPQI